MSQLFPVAQFTHDTLHNLFLRNIPPEPFNYSQRVGRAGRRSGHIGFALSYCRRNPHDLYHYAKPLHMLSGKTNPPSLQLGNKKILMRHVTAVALSAFFRSQKGRFENVSTFVGNFHKPTATSSFQTFLCEQKKVLTAQLMEIVPESKYSELGLENGNWIETITDPESALAEAEAEICHDYLTVEGLANKSFSAQPRDTQTGNWADARANTIAGEDVISFLSRKAIIPKYGFPVDTVELDTLRSKKNAHASEVSLQRDLSIAIAEFAPTAELVANKKLWTSYGLKYVPEKEAERRYYKRCSEHNVFIQWKKGDEETPTPCGHDLERKEYVIPKFGFVTSRDKPKEPTSAPQRVFSTRPFFAGTQGPDPDLILFPSDERPLIKVKPASPGKLVVLCEGQRSQGFRICEKCGAGVPIAQESHKNPLGKPCKGRLHKLNLGHDEPGKISV